MKGKLGKPEVTITSNNRVSLPVESLRELGWQPGERLMVTVMGGNMLVLSRPVEGWTDFYSGKVGDVWGDHEDTLRYLDEERASWSERFPDPEAEVKTGGAPPC